MFVARAPGDDNRLYIAERGTPVDNVTSNSSAAIKILDLTTGVVSPTPLLTITGLDVNGEGGLLGLAFHPDFATNRKFYVNVTAGDDIPSTAFSTEIREYTVSANPNVANTTFDQVFTFEQPQANHNGGWLGFGPNDGYLYVMTGDGGNGNDQGTGHIEPGGNGQSLDTLLGKVLRVDVNSDDFTGDATRKYHVPVDQPGAPGNPFAPNTTGGANPAGADEIWAYGLRNPFRAGFDRATGDLWIGDVGQDRREEIDIQAASSAGGENYGWRLREGKIATPGVGGASPAGAIEPIWDYKHASSPDVLPADADFTGVTVIGGVPYRGPDPTLQGVYFFADTSNGRIWTLRRLEGGGVDVTLVNSMIPTDTGSPNSPVAISEDAVGNLYVTYLSGSVYRIVTNQLTPGDFNADAKVDDADLALWKAGFGTTTGALAKNGDADGDGDVDGIDYTAWQKNFGWSALNVGGSPAASVPEPTSAALMALGLFILGRTTGAARKGATCRRNSGGRSSAAS